MKMLAYRSLINRKRNETNRKLLGTNKDNNIPHMIGIKLLTSDNFVLKHNTSAINNNGFNSTNTKKSIKLDDYLNRAVHIYNTWPWSLQTKFYIHLFATQQKLAIKTLKNLIVISIPHMFNFVQCTFNGSPSEVLVTLTQKHTWKNIQIKYRDSFHKRQ